MNRHTFQDAVASKRSSLANELDQDGDEDDQEVGELRTEIEGEVDADKVLKVKEK